MALACPFPPRLVLRRLLAGLALWLVAAADAAGREFTVVLNDGFIPAAVQEAVLRPFAEAAGVPLDVQRWGGGVAALAARLAGQPGWDVLVLSGAELAAACQAGLVEKLDWGVLGGRERLVAGAASECGLGIAMRATVLSWDRDKIQGTPGWAEFGDVVKLPGRRGLRRHPRTTLEFALLADGVAPGEVYRTLRSEAGVERAFRRLDQLRPYLVWWRDDEEAAQLIASGEVVMTSAPSPVLAEANRLRGRNFALQWSGAVASVGSLAVVRGSPNQAQAMRLLAYAADPRVQARLAELASYGPATAAAVELLPAAAAAAAPSTPGALAALLPADEAFWREHHDRLVQRFDAWLPR